jgi:chromosome segregation ATPase
MTPNPTNPAPSSAPVPSKEAVERRLNTAIFRLRQTLRGEEWTRRNYDADILELEVLPFLSAQREAHEREVQRLIDTLQRATASALAVVEEKRALVESLSARLTTLERENGELRAKVDTLPELFNIWTKQKNELFSTIAQLTRERDEATKRADNYWATMCDTAEALGKVSPEAAPHIVGWANDLRTRLAAAELNSSELVKALVRIKKNLMIMAPDGDALAIADAALSRLQADKGKETNIGDDRHRRREAP